MGNLGTPNNMSRYFSCAVDLRHSRSETQNGVSACGEGWDEKHKIDSTFERWTCRTQAVINKFSFQLVMEDFALCTVFKMYVNNDIRLCGKQGGGDDTKLTAYFGIFLVQSIATNFGAQLVMWASVLFGSKPKLDDIS